MLRFVLFLMLFWLVGCQQNVKKTPDGVVTVDSASEHELMTYYRGLHLVGVRLLSEDAGAGGKANLERFYHFYISGNYSEAQNYLRKSLFADPFNKDSKAVAAQLEAVDLFGLLSASGDQQQHQVVQKRERETLLQVSRRIYGTEHLVVMLDRYNAQVNPDFRSTGQIYAPNTNRLGVLMDYVQTNPPNQNRTTSAPITIPTKVKPATKDEQDNEQETVFASVLEDVRTPETDQPAAVTSEERAIEQPEPVTAQRLYQEGNLIGAYRLLRTHKVTDQDKRLFNNLRDELVEAPYQRAVKYFHEQDVRQAVEGFRSVLRIEPDHQRAQQYLNRAIQLETRLRNID